MLSTSISTLQRTSTGSDRLTIAGRRLYVADSDRWYVVDVGAGFQAEPQGIGWMHPHGERTVSVMARPEIVLSRLQAFSWSGRQNTRRVHSLGVQRRAKRDL